MKEKTNASSRKHSRQCQDDKYVKGHSENGAANNSYKYRNVLKERHCRDDYENDKRERNHNNQSKHHSSSNKEKNRSLEHKSHQNHHKSISISRRRSKDRNEKNSDQEEVDESYEELSRKKRRIESELHALDLEEAAAREADDKRSQKHSSDSRRKKETIQLKEEPLSDDGQEKQIKAKTKRSVPKDKNKQSKSQPSKTSNDDHKWGKSSGEAKKTEKEKEKPDFAVSGKLAEDTNVFNGHVIKYNEPTEARKPKRRWRLYPFKGDNVLPFIPIHRQSAYLLGRTRSIADIPIDHPSCSKQHAVIQFRLVPYKREDGSTGRKIRPYIIDLESSNGTFVNNKPVEPKCYVELMEKDVIKFGYSSREYVLLHEESQGELDDDDVLLESD
ncbi:smad nuclear-interacting protein 1 [Caerostris extrusa]|uniref:Smad nuclear-interacting protein 1 n=1 Tax=Caerostris extrusa TaxID=172846 RepID=A0AAV4TZT1_CAEEX|nr:smad nuclear-interacting protein 1 [Caerostris extrusa]